MTVPEALPFMQAVYDRHATGCCLHIVLDDGNIKNSHVEFCIKNALEQGHSDCLRAACILMLCSSTQRIKLGEKVR